MVERASRPPQAEASRAPVRAAAPVTRRPLNWPLWIGGGVVGLIAVLALLGPTLAPHNPLQETFILRNYAGTWIKPPYGPVSVPGYWLGSDIYGRDLLSQILWAMRPTLTLVLTVAALRLTTGIVLGLAAGWLGGRIGRWLNTAISTSLSVPVLFVALGIITLFGVRYGVWAFILGLALTGWADSARVLSEQARAIKHRPYIEAAHALGASGGQLVYRHVLPQVMPMVWTMLAFEVSSALLAVAALGFLGYFIHSVWIPLGDWSAVRATGKPELGQMLATAFEARSKPWGMALAGSVVFLNVLGFNMLGEGLRQRLYLQSMRRRNPAADDVSGVMNDWIATQVFDPLSPWPRTIAVGSAAGALALVILAGVFNLWRSQAVTRIVGDLPVPGDHQWASERHDPYGTIRTAAIGPDRPGVQWVFEGPAGFSGGPVVAHDGTVYLTSAARRLYAVSAEGVALWHTDLAALPVGTPALNTFGDIYVADATGGLTVFDTDGRRLWSVDGDGFTAIAGPVVGLDGVAYYPTDGHVVAVTGEGQLKWRVGLPSYAYTFPVLTLSPQGDYIFFEDVAMDTANGAMLTDRTIDPFDRFFVGVDGVIYLGGAKSLLEWRTTAQGAEIVGRAEFDTRTLALGFRSLQAAGVTPDQHLWLLFNSPFEQAKIVWYDMDGNLREFVDYHYRNSRLIAVDGSSVMYTCGTLENVGLECQAVREDRRDAAWRLLLPNPNGNITGGALVSGRIYVTGGGSLYALDADSGGT